MIIRRCAYMILLAVLGSVWAADLHAQAFGVELHSNLNPASGGMGGVSLALPQDLQSSLSGNPATLSQRKGTQFSFGGAWVEPTINIVNDATIGANITPYSGKSSRPGTVVGDIAVTQDLAELNLPATVGVGLLSASGLGTSFRHIQASNGTTAELTVLQLASGIGVQLSENLSLGAALMLGTGTMDGPFTFATAATPDYALRGSFGLTYTRDCTTIGAWWMTEQKFKLDNFVQIGGPGNPFLQVKASLPSTYGIGVANTRLMNGRLLLGADFKFLDWSGTDFFGGLWEDQFVAQFGAQLTTWRRCKLRAGYTYAENITRNISAPTIGGVTPQAGIDYFQALFPAMNQHRFTAGVGVPDVVGGMDLDLHVGGMPRSSERRGQTEASLASYWIAVGMSWKFGNGCGK
jgi:long-chain fatty acid transport protein